MDRKEAIKRIQQDLETSKKYLSKEYKEALNMAIEALSEDRPIIEWKPISDSPPQRVGSYLVTCKGEHGFVYTDYDFWTVADEFKYNHDNVIAWVPFLEPYKGGDKE